MPTLDLRRLSKKLDQTTRGWLTVLAGDVGRMAHYGHYAVLAVATGVVGAVADFGLSSAAVRRIAGVLNQDSALARRRGSSFVWIRLFAAAAVALLGLAAVGMRSS